MTDLVQRRRNGRIAGSAAVVALLAAWVAGVSIVVLGAVVLALVVVGAARINGRQVLRQVFVVIPTMFAVTAFTFYLQNGRGDSRDLAFNLLGAGANDDAIATVVAEFHLDAPLWRRYLLWLADAVTGDLGRSAIQGREVSKVIADSLPITLQLMLYAQIMAVLIAVPLGVYAAYRANRRGDRIASTLALAGLSIPNFTLAVVLILFFALGGLSVFGHRVGFDFLPASRYVPFGRDPILHFKHLALPTLALAIGQGAAYMRVLRADMITTLQEPFVTTARAKGVPDRRILWAHALRPSSFTLLTILGVNTATLIGGALVIETIFSLPGLGTAISTSIFQRDFLVVQGIVVVIALGFILVNFLVDMLYALIDPRVRDGRN